MIIITINLIMLRYILIFHHGLSAMVKQNILFGKHLTVLTQNILFGKYIDKQFNKKK
jgi:hypothetical protein